MSVESPNYNVRAAEDRQLVAQLVEGDQSALSQLYDRYSSMLMALAMRVVGDPDAVKVNADANGDTVQLTVEVGPGDMGRVIGRRGRIANAIRTVVRAAGVRDGVNVDVEFLD